MSGSVWVRNCQRRERLNLKLLRKIAARLMTELSGPRDFDLGIVLVGAKQITALNERFLHHRGPTDVITFDYSDPGAPQKLSGEIVISVQQAREQAAKFRSSWESEVARYLVHGVLHLWGYDDRNARQRPKMKRAEDRFLQKLSSEFQFTDIGRPEK